MSHISRSARWVRWSAAPVAMVASSLLVWQASQSAFSDTTDNGANNWAAGDVVISDDDAASAMFNPTNLKPGDTATECIRVTYSGSLAATVKLYGSVTGTLDQYLDLTVEHGSGGTSASCAGFVTDATIYSGTLDNFGNTATNFATGVGSWAPAGPGQNKTYRFTYTVQNNNAAQATTAQATFTWEAQNS